jgi:hypothetical protein
MKATSRAQESAAVQVWLSRLAARNPDLAAQVMEELAGG